MSYEIKSNSAWKFEDIFMFHFKNEQNLHFAQGFTNFCNSFVINNSLMKVIIFFLLKVFQRGVDSTVWSCGLWCWWIVLCYTKKFFSVHRIYTNEDRLNNRNTCIMQNSSMAPRTTVSKMAIQLNQYLWNKLPTKGLLRCHISIHHGIPF